MHDEVAESRAKWDASAFAWIDHVGKVDNNREHLLDAPMLEQAGDVEGRDVLDVGCGEGRFCRMMAARGARVVGIDPTVPFLEHASIGDPRQDFVRAVGEHLPLQSDSFDLAVTYLTLIDIPDFRAAIKEIARVLRPGGQVIVANLNPFATTRPTAWYRDGDGRKLHVAVEEYYEERASLLEWSGLSIYNWHRSMEAYMQAFLAAGLLLQYFAEPRPSEEAVREHPAMLDEYKVPIFHVMRWAKV